MRSAISDVTCKTVTHACLQIEAAQTRRWCTINETHDVSTQLGELQLQSFTVTHILPVHEKTFKCFFAGRFGKLKFEVPQNAMLNELHSERGTAYSECVYVKRHVEVMRK